MYNIHTYYCMITLNMKRECFLSSVGKKLTKLHQGGPRLCVVRERVSVLPVNERVPRYVLWQ